MGIECNIVLIAHAQHPGIQEFMEDHDADIQSEDDDEEVVGDLGYRSDNTLYRLISELAAAQIEASIHATAWSIPDEEDRVIHIKQEEGAWYSQTLLLSEQAKLESYTSMLELLAANPDPATLAQTIRQKINTLAELSPIELSPA